ncbi:glycosyltransferase [Rosenbergiella epipactidis]|uniref:glycosyltransferase n=1 Tax=Rosenbergiella epipactidis TaxID=1544694 RepID=UPI001F4DE1A4|nr:glycosyltransferase [Rosenbergiella epipactidis]
MFFGQNTIKSQVKFCSLDDSEDLNIAYGADDKFIFGAGVSIESVIINNKHKKLRFHIFTDDISRDNAAKLARICDKHKTAINIYNVDSGFIKTLPSNKAWNHAIYFRLMIADYFQSKVEKVLYLDSDVFCSGDIGYLIDLDISGYTVAAVNDPSTKHIIKTDELFCTNFAQVGYFNSGVMLININEWGKQSITEKSMNILINDSKMNALTYYDQDAINVATNGNVLFIDNIFNYIIDLNYKYKCTENLAHKKASLFHFVGLTKPWHEWSQFYRECEPFNVAKSSSPWHDEPLIKPVTKYNHKYSAKHYRFNGRIFRALRDYIKYKALS